MEVKHVVFNPTIVVIGDSPLFRVCEREEKSGWKLDKVVTFHMYESVAVFVRSSKIEQREGRRVELNDSIPAEEKEDVNLLLVNAVWNMLDEVDGSTSLVREVVRNAIKSWQSYEGHVGRNGY